MQTAIINARLLLTAAVVFGVHTVGASDAPTDRAQVHPFVDAHLIESISGDVSLQVQKPEPREVVLVTDEPWEGNTSAYYTILQDGGVYRMYYRGSHAIDMKSAHEEVVCYAESSDGRRWNKPRLGLFDWEGSKQNNIVWRGIGSHCFTPFLDENPDRTDDARFKAISRGRPHGKKGLYIFQSADGIHWSLIQDEPVITDGAFDSQNLAFWDPAAEQYVCYSRTFVDGVRAIQRCVSDDFRTWSTPELLTCGDSPNQHLYTNAIRPYPGVPNIRIGFPTRYTPATQQVEPVFMASRDGMVFHRYYDAIIPQYAPADRDGNRSNYMANGLVTLPDYPNEWSVYATEAYYEGPDSRLRRFVYEKDRLVALSGTGEVLTKPLTMTGTNLILNYRCDKGGSVDVELCDESGTAIPGFTRIDSKDLTGDSSEGLVEWNGCAASEDIPPALRLRLILDDADVFAFRFAE